MLLAADIGNTKTAFGLFEDARLIEKWQIENRASLSIEQIGKSITAKIDRPIDGFIIASVVPGLNPGFQKLSKNLFGIEPVFVSTGLDFGMPVKYDTPATLGADRLADAFAAREKYGAPVIVCDFGTATTIDAVDADGCFLGGTITPGMMTMAESLFRQTAKLPKIDISKPERVIGKSTDGSIQSGIYFGYIGLVEGIIARMMNEFGENPKVIATGGLAGLISKGTDKIDVVDPDLMLEGLNLIYKRLS